MADSDTSENRVSYRTMGTQSIAKSFKGILRIAHIQENVTGVEDKLFRSEYYNGDFTSLYDITGGTYNDKIYAYAESSKAFDGTIARYQSSDDYINQKLPVTDSVGNFLNFFVGPDGTVFGSDENTGGYSLDTVQLIDGILEEYTEDKVIPAVKTSTIYVGKGEFNDPGTLTSISLNVDYDTTTNHSYIIIDNVYDHSNVDYKTIYVKTSLSDNSAYDDGNPLYTEVSAEDYEAAVNTQDRYSPQEVGTYQLEASGDDKYKKRRTIYDLNNTEVKEYDVIMHNQEDYDLNNYLNNNTIDSFINVKNLKDYITERVNKFVQDGFIEVPTGSVIWQYCDLNKWYGTTDTGDIDSLLTDSGTRPIMNAYAQDRKIYSSSEEAGGDFSNNCIQYATLGYNKLLANGDNILLDSNGTFSTESSLDEIIPIFKRDYVLCDGAPFYMFPAYSLYNSATQEDTAYKINNQNLTRFFNLFFAIGYEYTEKETVTAQTKWYPPYEDPDNEGFYLKKEYVSYDIYNYDWKNLLYTINVLALQGAKLFIDQWNSDSSIFITNTKFDRDKANEWMASQYLPMEYIFNDMPVKSGSVTSSTWKYDTDNSLIYDFQNWDVNIGTEIYSFSDEISYLVIDSEGTNNTYKFVQVPIYKMGEIQRIFEIFENFTTSVATKLESEFIVVFQVPNFNIRELYSDSESSYIYSTGGFMASDPFTSLTEYSSSDNGVLYSKCDWSSSSLPHRHYLFHSNQYDTYKGKAGSCISSTDGYNSYMPRTSSDGDLNSSSIPAAAWASSSTCTGDCYAIDELSYCLKYETDPLNGARTIVWNRDEISTSRVSEYYFPEKISSETTTLNYYDPRYRNMEPCRGPMSASITHSSLDSSFKYSGTTGACKTTIAASNLVDCGSSGSTNFFEPESLQMLPLIKL